MKSPIYPEIKMRKIDKNGVEISYCPKSGGVWLEKGKLERLIDLETRNEKIYGENILFRKTRGKNYRDFKYYRRSNRKNMLSEVFDIF